MEVISTEWLTANVGQPSNKRGSTYSKIFQLVAACEKRDGMTVDNLQKVLAAFREWTLSRHSGAKSDEARERKASQQIGLNTLSLYVGEALVALGVKLPAREDFWQFDLGRRTHAKEWAILMEAVDEMEASSDALQRNSAGHLKDTIPFLTDGNVPDDEYGIGVAMCDTGGTLGSWQARQRRITLNPVITLNKPLLKGVLVHEVHHSLIRYTDMQFKYLDEFVAHWKQFGVQHRFGDRERAERVNQALKKNYGNAYDRWVEKGRYTNWPGMRPIESPDEFGDWALPDNQVETTPVRHRARKA